MNDLQHFQAYQETSSSQPKMEGKKFDSNKDPMDLLPMLPLGHVSRVLGFGAVKYGPDNWRDGLKYRRLLGATLRHVAAFQDGEDLDPETGLSHIDHAICELLFLSQFIHEGRKELDDRYRKPIKESESMSYSVTTRFLPTDTIESGIYGAKGK